MEKKPKILVWDLETGGVNAFYADLGFILNFGYKWVGEKTTHVLRVSDYENWFNKEREWPIDDRGLIQDALKIMSEADMLVAHFGDKFDRRFFKGRTVIHGLPPLPPTIQRDTCKLSWIHFKFRSNRLGALADHFNLDQHKYQKKRSEWPGWWLRAMAGSAKAVRAMGEYCKQDVRTTEEVYLRILPYDTQHPRLYSGKYSCKKCGSPMWNHGFRRSKERIYRRLFCSGCGSVDQLSAPEKNP